MQENNMKKVTLLGDSIRLGYSARTIELLNPDFDVWQPEENCRYSQYTLRGIWEWSKAMEGSEIVHWNNGLWDECELFGDGSFTPIDSYVETMIRIARILKKRHGCVIFATTTPVRDENIYHNNELIELFNARVVPELMKEGVIINDLHALLKDDIAGNIRSDDRIHLTEQGVELCAQQVAAVIRSQAGKS